ncbi:hypothetical protein LCGC14_1645640 [marine sediment metagenome]|uniref:Uncharacterized protein n=1 Tax=marine sediment metagenome TaxID=412755 RepID=A0A0F9KE59_9ZZZZ
MAASAWTMFPRGRHHIGTETLSAGTYRLTLHKTAASTNLSASGLTLFASIGNICTGGGLSATALANIKWTAGASANISKWDCDDIVLTASGSDITSVRFAVIRLSTGASEGKPICYAALSTAEFTVSTGNTLTIQLATTGIFTLT